VNFHQANRTRHAGRRQTPRLEALESRRLLSGKPAPQVTIKELPLPTNVSTFGTPGTDELLITGTKGNDNISITDNATGASGNITVSVASKNFVSTGTVTAIIVRTGTGNDNVTYELDGELQPNVTESIAAGSGTKSGGGSLKFTANIMGKIPDGASVYVFGYSDLTKPTIMTVSDNYEIDGFLESALAPGSRNPNRQGGREVFNFSSSSTIGPEGEIDAELTGGPKNDGASILYSGLNNGDVTTEADGLGGSNQFSADLDIVPGSTGIVGEPQHPSFLRTFGKKDYLRFTIHRGADSTSTGGIFAQIIDNSRTDVSQHTGNVTAMTRGSDTIFP
jgi:hypothetical protein